MWYRKISIIFNCFLTILVLKFILLRLFWIKNDELYFYSILTNWNHLFQKLLIIAKIIYIGTYLNWLVFKIVFIFIVLLINMTLIIASVTLLERKILSLSQRRIGPQYIGYKGRLQYIADAIKLFLKGFIYTNNSQNFWFLLSPSLIFSTCYIFWLNSLWSPNLEILEIEFNIFFGLILSSLFSYIIILTGFSSKNKYAILASLRTVLMTLNLELLLGLLFLSLTFFSKSLSLSYFSYLQDYISIIINYSLFVGLIAIIFFLETGRAPFDLQEAESELISGYNTEYGGFYFALYYLGEYFHLFFFSLFFITSWFGFENSNFIFFKHILL